MHVYEAYFLLIYFIIFFGIAFFGISFRVAQKIGINPMVLPKDDSAAGLVGFYFKLTMIVLFLYVLSLVFLDYKWMIPIPYLEFPLLQWIGAGCMLIAFVWVVMAQLQMKESWRIGIDPNDKTSLVTNGLFSISRNPVFFGMMIALVGLALFKPNLFSLLFLIISWILIQIQIRFEEAFLSTQHGLKYQSYQQKTRRYI